jgi:nitroreductase
MPYGDKESNMPVTNDGAVTPVLAADALVERLRWRYAVKKFDAAKKIPAEIWKALEEVLVLAPSSFGLQPWKFFVVTDPAVREKLKPASWNQTQITDASHLVVFAIKKDLSVADVEHFAQRIVEVRGVPEKSLEMYKKIMADFVGRAGKGLDINAWAADQVYIALGTFMTAAAVLGIDTCPMEGFEPAKYDEILGLPALGFHATVLATAGYRAADDVFAKLPKVRYKKEEVIGHIG